MWQDRKGLWVVDNATHAVDVGDQSSVELGDGIRIVKHLSYRPCSITPTDAHDPNRSLCRDIRQCRTQSRYVRRCIVRQPQQLARRHLWRSLRHVYVRVDAEIELVGGQRTFDREICLVCTERLTCRSPRCTSTPSSPSLPIDTSATSTPCSSASCSSPSGTGSCPSKNDGLPPSDPPRLLDGFISILRALFRRPPAPAAPGRPPLGRLPPRPWRAQTACTP